MRTLTKAAAKKSAIYLLGLATVLKLRGYYLSQLIDGRYTWRSLAQDTLGLALLMVFFHGAYFGLNKALHPLWTSERKQSRAIAGVIRVTFVVVVVFPALIGFVQVHPQKIEPTKTPQSAGLEYEKVVITSDGLNLRGWFIPGLDHSDAVVLLAHGLNANKQNFLYPAKLLHELGYPVLTFDLRSHGESEGRTFTFGIKEKADIKAGYDWLREKFPSKKIYGVGYSAGGAALLQAAAQFSIFDKIVLDSTFASLERIAKKLFLFPFGPLQEPVWQLGRLWAFLWTEVDLQKYDGLNEIKALSGRPIMIIHGTSDHIIPSSESILLSDAAPPGTQVWLIDGADHLQGLSSPEYSRRLGEFLHQ